jgi:hypothetical protein
MDTYAIGQTVGKTIKYGAAVAIAVGIIAACSGKKEEPKTKVVAPMVAAEAQPKPVVKEPINIKGIYIGMSESAYRSIIVTSHAELKKQCHARHNDESTRGYLCRDLYTDTITLGGVETNLYPKIEQGILRSVQAGYLRDSDGDSYLKVKQAIQSKYPDLKCDTNEVRNRMNAAFEAQVCRYNDGKSQMRIAFRDGSVDYSTFQLFDVAWNNEQHAKKSAKVSKDI